MSLSEEHKADIFLCEHFDVYISFILREAGDGWVKVLLLKNKINAGLKDFLRYFNEVMPLKHCAKRQHEHDIFKSMQNNNKNGNPDGNITLVIGSSCIINYILLERYSTDHGGVFKWDL